MGNLSIELRQLAEVAGLSNANLKDAKSYRNQSLRGYGNGIVPQLAAEFIKAFMETNEPTS